MTLIRNIIIAGVIAMLTAPALSAQGNLATAEVPFNFTVGTSNFTAGSYSVSTLINHSIIVLRNTETEEAIILANTIRGDDKCLAVLVFHRYGDRYFLSEVDSPGTPAYILTKGSLEREISMSAKATMTYVALVR